MAESHAPLDERERAAPTLTLRRLGKLDRLDEVARDFARRGVHALTPLGDEAEERFDLAYWSGDDARPG